MRIMKFGILILVALGIFACANANQETKKSGQASTSKVSAKQSSAAQVSDDLSTHVNDTPAKNQIIKSTSSTDNIKVVTKEKPKPKPTATQSTKPVSQPNTETAVAKKTEETGLIQNIKEKIQEKKEERQEVKEQKMIDKTPTKPDPVTKNKEVTKPAEPKKSGRVAQSRPMHKFLDYILKNNVSAEGVVNYRAIKSDGDRLDKYLADLQNFPPKDDWTKSEKLAYWINAYNAYTIKLIIDNYPLASIQDLYGGKPWDHSWIELDGKTLSLNAIENEIIRPTFNEPRIHFAVNCAAKSCPPLSNAAYTKDNLEQMLADNTSAFINDERYNVLTKQPAEVSKI